MPPQETIEAPTMGQRITWLADTAGTGGAPLRFGFWMRGDAPPPPLHVHPRQEERIEVVSGSVRSLSGGVERVLGPGETVSTPPGEPHTVGPARRRTGRDDRRAPSVVGLRALRRAHVRLGSRRPRRCQGTGQPAAPRHRETARGRVLLPARSDRAAASRPARAGPAGPAVAWRAGLTRARCKQARAGRCTRRRSSGPLAPAPITASAGGLTGDPASTHARRS